MAIIKKVVKILAILIVSLTLLILGLTKPTWPSKAKLCQDVERYLPPKMVTQFLKQMKLNELVEMAQGKREGVGGSRPASKGR